jgi:hypothetical protein
VDFLRGSRDYSFGFHLHPVLYHAPHIPAGMALEWVEVALESKIDDVAAKSLIKTLFQWII